MRHGHEWWELFWEWLLFKTDELVLDKKTKNWLKTAKQLFSAKWGIEGPETIRDQIRVPPISRSGEEK